MDVVKGGGSLGEEGRGRLGTFNVSKRCAYKVENAVFCYHQGVEIAEGDGGLDEVDVYINMLLYPVYTLRCSIFAEKTVFLISICV